jgi:hypothetical protein
MCFTSRGHGSAIDICVALAVLGILLGWCPIPGRAGQQTPQQGIAKGQEKEKAATKQPPEPAWKADLVRDYGLKTDEVLRRVGAPFPACREAYLQSLKADLFSDLNVDEIVANYRWDGKNVEWWSLAPAPDKRMSWSLGNVLAHCGVLSQETEGDTALFDQHIAGEFVVRTGAPIDKVITRLEQILKEELKIHIRLKFAQVEREVIVVRGKYESKPRVNRKLDQVDLFAVSLNEDSGSGGGWGTFDEFLGAIGSYIGRRLVSELPKSPAGKIRWYYHNSARVLDGPDPNQDPDGVLKNVTAQTGLTFQTEKRKVSVPFVEKE